MYEHRRICIGTAHGFKSSRHCFLFSSCFLLFCFLVCFFVVCGVICLFLSLSTYALAFTFTWNNREKLDEKRRTVCMSFSFFERWLNFLSSLIHFFFGRWWWWWWWLLLLFNGVMISSDSFVLISTFSSCFVSSLVIDVGWGSSSIWFDEDGEDSAELISRNVLIMDFNGITSTTTMIRKNHRNHLEEQKRKSLTMMMTMM